MKYVYLLILFTLAGCLGAQTDNPTIQQPGSCTVSKYRNQTTITCQDGTSSVIEDGSSGLNGSDGKDAPGCAITQIAAGDNVLPYGGAIIDCGPSSALISNGTPGAAGSKGDTGDMGPQGDSGTNGRDGVNAQPSAYAIDSIVDPCGDSQGIDDEVFIKLANGTMLWLEVDNAGGKNPRLSLARPGRWIATDGSGCEFTLNADGSITGETLSHKNQD